MQITLHPMLTRDHGLESRPAVASDHEVSIDSEPLLLRIIRVEAKIRMVRQKAMDAHALFRLIIRILCCCSYD
jgi:hypothetical protein